MRPLVKRAPDGRPYTVPSVPCYPATAPASQPVSDTPSYRPQPRYGMAKLTDDDVRAIRAEYAEGKWTHADLAYIYDVSVPTISNVVRRVSYTHVTAEPTPLEQES